jgi:AcrR family transcriptional regulator
MAESSLAAAPASRSTHAARPAPGRQRLLAAAERLLATRGLEVPSRVIVAAAGQHNQSAVTYHFGSRAGLIDAIRERHETPIAQHRRHLIARLPDADDRTARQLVEAHVQPVAAEMLRCTPSHWARLSELLMLDQPLRFTRDAGAPVPGRPDKGAWPALAELTELVVAHLTHLPELEAADRVALAFRFLISSLARWERDSQAGLDAGPLAPFTLVLTDLAVAMLEAPGSVPCGRRR